MNDAEKKPELQGKLREFLVMRNLYEAAARQLTLKFEILNDEFSVLYARNPILPGTRLTLPLRPIRRRATARIPIRSRTMIPTPLLRMTRAMPRPILRTDITPRRTSIPPTRRRAMPPRRKWRMLRRPG